LPEIHVPEEVRIPALKAVRAMLEISK
jgi:hypothetical protein